MIRIVNFLIVITVLMYSCSPKGNPQDAMFVKKKANKQGIYSHKENKRKPVSLEIAEGYQKMNKHYDNPEKAAKIAKRQYDKKKNAAGKRNAKMFKKRNRKLKGKQKGTRKEKHKREDKEEQ